MHGLGNALSIISNERHTANHADVGSDAHEVIGVCVYLASVAGLGLAMAARRRGSYPTAGRRPMTTTRTDWYKHNLRRRLRILDLGVLRL